MSLAFVVSGSIARVLEKGFPLLIFMLRNRLPLDCRVNSIGGPIIYRVMSTFPLFSDEVTFSTFAKFIPSTRSRISIHSHLVQRNADIHRFLANHQQVVTLLENSTNRICRDTDKDFRTRTCRWCRMSSVSYCALRIDLLMGEEGVYEQNHGYR